MATVQPKKLFKNNANPYIIESIIAKVLGYLDQKLTKDSSPQFKGLTLTGGDLKITGNIQLDGVLNEIGSEVINVQDLSLVLGSGNTLPFHEGSLAIHRGASAEPDVFLKFTEADTQWSLFDGNITASIAHFSNLTDSRITGNNKFPVTLDTSTGSLIPTNTFQVPLTFRNSVTFPSGYNSNVNLGVDSQWKWNNLPGTYFGLNLLDSATLELRNASTFSLQDQCDLLLNPNSAIFFKPISSSSAEISISGEVPSLVSAANSGGVDLIFDTGSAASGGTSLIRSTLDTADRSSFTVQGGQYINRGLTFGPSDQAGANAPRLYTLLCPTINTIQPFGKEFVIQPSSNAANPILSTELNLVGLTPALRLTSGLNATSVNLQVDSSLTSNSVTTLRLNALSRSTAQSCPLNMVIDAQQSNFNGNMAISGNATVNGTLTQSQGILSPSSLTTSTLLNIDSVTFRLIAISTPSQGWCNVAFTAEITPNQPTTNTLPIGFNVQLPARTMNFAYVGDVILQSKAVAYDSNNVYGKDTEITAFGLPGSTFVRVTVEADESVVHVVQLNLLYRSI